jgi:hypothetical protein
LVAVPVAGLCGRFGGLVNAVPKDRQSSVHMQCLHAMYAPNGTGLKVGGSAG